MSYRDELRDELMSFGVGPTPAVVATEPTGVEWMREWNGPSVSKVLEARRARRSVLRSSIVPNKGFSTRYGLELHKSAHGKIEATDKRPERTPYYEIPEDERRNPHPLNLLATSCARVMAVYGVCSDVFCVGCAHQRSVELRARIEPELSKMYRPKMITLTIRSGDDLEAVYRALLASWRRAMEYSLGSRGLARLMADARHLVNVGWAVGLLDDERAARLAVELERFEKRVAKKWRRWVSRRPVRFRDLLGYGWRVTETTAGDAGWHPHFHLCADCLYIPQPVLRALWTIVTRGAGEVVDIRAVSKDKSGLAEVSKYFAKPTLQSLSDDAKNDVRALAYGMVKCQAFGVKNGKRYEIPPAPAKPCKHCESLYCKRHHLGEARILSAETLDDGARLVRVEFAGREFNLLEHGGVLEAGDEAQAALSPLLDNIGRWRNRTSALSGAATATGPPGAGPPVVVQ